MEYTQMKYYPNEIYYENRDGINYIVLDYGDRKVEHALAAEQGVRRMVSHIHAKDVVCPACHGEETDTPLTVHRR